MIINWQVYFYVVGFFFFWSDMTDTTNVLSLSLEKYFDHLMRKDWEKIDLIQKLTKKKKKTILF